MLPEHPSFAIATPGPGAGPGKRGGAILRGRRVGGQVRKHRRPAPVLRLCANQVTGNYIHVLITSQGTVSMDQSDSSKLICLSVTLLAAAHMQRKQKQRRS
jgi:hypothetical protein